MKTIGLQSNLGHFNSHQNYVCKRDFVRFFLFVCLFALI